MVLATTNVRQDEAFLSGIREKRLEVMASFAQGKQASSDIATAGIDMDDVEPVKSHSFRTHDDGKHDASTIQLMHTIMQKLDQQAEELKHIKAALALRPPPVELPLEHDPVDGHVEQPTIKQDAKANTSSNPSYNMPAHAPLTFPRQNRLQQLSSRKDSREIGEG